MPAKLLVNLVNRKNSISKFSRYIGCKVAEQGADRSFRRFRRFLAGGVLDVGVGVGSMAKILGDHGYLVTGIDIVDSSVYPEVIPLVYDGSRMPFRSKSHDNALLICVLHHCTDQLGVLTETMRVAKRLILIEDTFRNSIEKALVSARDCLGNFEFYDHHYRTTEEWVKIIRAKDWQVVHKEEWSSFTWYGMYGRQTLLVAEPN